MVPDDEPESLDDEIGEATCGVCGEVLFQSMEVVRFGVGSLMSCEVGEVEAEGEAWVHFACLTNFVEGKYYVSWMSHERGNPGKMSIL